MLITMIVLTVLLGASTVALLLDQEARAKRARDFAWAVHQGTIIVYVPTQEERDALARGSKFGIIEEL